MLPDDKILKCPCRTLDSSCDCGQYTPCTVSPAVIRIASCHWRVLNSQLSGAYGNPFSSFLSRKKSRMPSSICASRAPCAQHEGFSSKPPYNGPSLFHYAILLHWLWTEPSSFASSGFESGDVVWCAARLSSRRQCTTVPRPRTIHVGQGYRP